MSATMISVNSSAIRAVGYDGYTLTIEFNSGRSYTLRGVPEYRYYGLLNASSPGWYFNTYLKGRY
jgi:hypothetical protein